LSRLHEIFGEGSSKNSQRSGKKFINQSEVSRNSEHSGQKSKMGKMGRHNLCKPIILQLLSLSTVALANPFDVSSYYVNPSYQEELQV